MPSSTSVGFSQSPVSEERGGALVLLVEDEESISEPFARALARAGFRTEVARTGGEAIELASALGPDVVLLDLALPDQDGRDVCRALRQHSDVPIIMVTASGTLTDRVVGLELGADDYVVKPFSVAEVVARIRAVLRRGRSDSPDSIELTIGELRIDLPARRVWRAGEEVELTRKEFDLLARLARDAGRVVTREALMSDVWDMNWFGSTKTLDVHIAWLRRKLGDDPARPTYIHTVRGVGFRLASPRGGLAVTLRTRLLAALAYVLLLAIVALGVPLAINLSARVNAEVRTQAQAQADLVAASAADLLGPGQRRTLETTAQSAADSVRGRILVVDAGGRVLADSAGPAQLGTSYASRPEIQRGPERPAGPGYSAARRRSDRRSWPPRSRSSTTAGRSARCGSRRASQRSTPRSAGPSSW